eukprot:TRINITY_DN28173_c0_g1_i1.p1 TRINITY_DN28173_c0_g1~~TRINITY_DN28173_c0_g1_i1.p1  ORF type:complete len:349 (+),score=62.15 TRINITY_DN28173_c0_g1_i1:71-1117(+)
MTGVEGRPKLSEEDVPKLLERFGLATSGAEWKELPAFEDYNLRITTKDGKRYVLKAHNALLPSGTPERLAAQDRLITRLHEKGLPVPSVVTATCGKSILELEPAAPGQPVPHARLLTYVEGDVVPNEVPKDNKFLQGVGVVVGKVANALEGFEDPGAHWTWDWDMKNVTKVVRRKLSFISNEDRRRLATRLADEYAEAMSETKVGALPHAVIHADLNDTNLLYNGDEVCGIIDFGDSIYSCRAFEPAIAAGYYSLGQADPMMVFKEVLRGYLRTVATPFSSDELLAYFHAARGRILLSVSFGAENMSLEPDNEYLAHTSEPGWAVLSQLADVSDKDVLVQLEEVAKNL